MEKPERCEWASEVQRCERLTCPQKREEDALPAWGPCTSMTTSEDSERGRRSKGAPIQGGSAAGKWLSYLLLRCKDGSLPAARQDHLAKPDGRRRRACLFTALVSTGCRCASCSPCTSVRSYLNTLTVHLCIVPVLPMHFIVLTLYSLNILYSFEKL